MTTLMLLPPLAPAAPRFIDPAAAATLLRADLKVSFPGIKFAVRISRYSGGSSINVRWTNGPTVKQVNMVAGHYASSEFDGRSDSRTSVNATRPDGEVVRYGSDYVFCARDIANEQQLEAELVAMILARCSCEKVGNGWRFGDDWVENIARQIYRSVDFRIETRNEVFDLWSSGRRHLWN